MINEDILKIVMGFRPIDDNFMKLIFKDNKPLVEYVLRIILDKDDLVVESSETQFDLSLVGSHGLMLDVFAKDSSGKNYNIEIQRADKGALPQRARYHASMIDVKFFSSGAKYENLLDTYVIFITENDVLKGNEATYTIDRTIAETGEQFNDGTHIIYVNGAYQDVSTSIGKLIHDFVCRNAGDMLCEPMADITKQFKETPEGVGTMCKEVEEYAKRYAEKERQQGILDSIKRIIKGGELSYESIAKTFEISVDEVKRIAATV